MNTPHKKLIVASILTLILCAGSFNVASAATVGTSPVNSSANGLVGYWTFDGPNLLNNVKDSSGQVNNGFMRNFTSTSSAVVTGKTGQGLKFDGVDDYVQVPSSGSLPAEQPMSVSVWLKPSSATAGFVLASRPFSGNGWNITYAFGNRMMFQHDGIGDLSARTNSNFGTFSTTQWTHIVVTWDGTTDATHVLIYKNGVVQPHDTDTNGTSLTSTAGQILYIVSDQAGSGFFNGSMDDFRMYNRVITTAEINQLYLIGTRQAVSPQVTATSSCSTGLSCGLVGYWTFDGKDSNWSSATTGTTNDKSGNGNTGTFSNMSQSFSPMVGKIGQGLLLDGVNDKINITPEIIGINTVTVCGWFKPPRGTGYFYTLVDDVDFNLQVAVANNPYERINVSSSYLGSPLTSSSAHSVILGIWNHMCVTRTSAGTTNFFINGVQSGTVDQAGGTPTNISGSGPSIGGNAAGGNYFQGPIDDFRFYNRVLSAAEIKQIYSLGALPKQGVSPAVTNASSCSTGLSCGLIGYWTFDGKDSNWSSATAGTTNDKSGNGNTGTFNNMTQNSTPVTAKIGQGLKFAVNEYITTAADFIGTSAATACFWLLPDAVPSEIFISNGKFLVQTASSQRVALSSDGSTLANSASNALIINKWNYVCTSRDASGSANIYINVVLSGSANQNTGTPASGLGNVVLGAGHNGGSRSTGIIDDIRIYSRVLSASEIIQLYNIGK